MIRRRLLPLLVALGLIAAACGGGEPETIESAAAEGSIATVAGSQIDLNSLEGQDTVLWFWAPW